MYCPKKYGHHLDSSRLTHVQFPPIPYEVTIFSVGHIILYKVRNLRLFNWSLGASFILTKTAMDIHSYIPSVMQSELLVSSKIAFKLAVTAANLDIDDWIS